MTVSSTGLRAAAPWCSARAVGALGFIPLGGVAAESGGAIVLLYLRHAWDERVVQGRTGDEDLLDTIREGAVLRVRPKACWRWCWPARASRRCKRRASSAPARTFFPRIELLDVYPTAETLLAQLVAAAMALAGFWASTCPSEARSAASSIGT